jgi:hypothetical protein
VYQRLTSDTVGAARAGINRVTGEIGRALDERPGTDEAVCPLRLTVHLALNDLEAEGPISADQYAEGGYTSFQANTVQEARTVLDHALCIIDAEMALRPAHRRHCKAQSNRPLRASLHYDLADLDREGPLSVDECLHIPYVGLPPGLQPHNCHPEYAIRDRRPARRVSPQPPRTLLQRLLNLG